MARIWILTAGALVCGCAFEIPEGAVVDISPGELVFGSLDSSDFELNDGSVADGYRLELAQEQAVTIVVRSSEANPMDPYVFLFREETREEIMHDDDSGRAFDARLLFTADRNDRYVIIVTTYETGLHEGEYEVEVFDGLRPTQL